VIALALGGILAGFYLWRRDLVANMIGRFAVDFVANVFTQTLLLSVRYLMLNATATASTEPERHIYG